jgi:hypothetical protein
MIVYHVFLWLFTMFCDDCWPCFHDCLPNCFTMFTMCSNDWLPCCLAMFDHVFWRVLTMCFRKFFHIKTYGFVTCHFPNENLWMLTIISKILMFSLGNSAHWSVLCTKGGGPPFVPAPWRGGAAWPHSINTLALRNLTEAIEPPNRGVSKSLFKNTVVAHV